MATYLTSTDCALGDPGGKCTIWYVGLLYAFLLAQLWQHPKVMTLVGATAAFCELVEGAELLRVDRSSWATLRASEDVCIAPRSAKAVEQVFSASFFEVGVEPIPDAPSRCASRSPALTHLF